MKINVLGTEYAVTVKKYEEDEVFERRHIDGYCDGWTKDIVICDLSTYPGWEHDLPETVQTAQKEALRHEIVHAFFDESGLMDSASAYDGAWSTFEEMIDWWAIQGPKVYKAWEAAGAL